VNALDKLVLMANQIAANLKHEPDPASATAEHIRLFWDPRMKRMIRSDSISGLSDVARQAIGKLRVEAGEA
jgi:formate dehydrogenase subunit delta